MQGKTLLWGKGLIPKSKFRKEETFLSFKIDLPQNVAFIIHTLEEAGHEAYAVGGCVRDAALGKEPNDWDITTSAEPLEVKKLFRRTIDTGIKHGTVTIMIKNEGYEVTTYRVDGEYHDHRRPESVQFTRCLEEDLKRRDFTINAMAYSDSKGLVDMFHGMEDLDMEHNGVSGIIRAVGNADERFDEDALRILRAVRFAAQLGFTIEEDTAKAAAKHAPDLKAVSAERIETELTKLLLSNHPEELEVAYKLGITKVILPEFDRMMETEQHTPYHKYDVGHHTMEVIRNIPARKTLRWAALLHDSGKPDAKTTDEAGRDHFKGHNVISEEIAKKVLRRMKLDNQTIKDVSKIVYWHDYGLRGGLKKTTFRQALSKMGIDYFDDIIAIRKADMAGQSDYKKDESIQALNEMLEMHKEIVEAKDPLSVGDLKITGGDLIQAGVKPGPQMGQILKELLEDCLGQPEHNNSEYLMKRALKMAGVE